MEMPSKISLIVIETRQKVWYALKSTENHAMFSSPQQTPSFPYETDKIYGNGHLEILVQHLGIGTGTGVGMRI